MLFHRLSLEAFCHATEDLEKVKEAMTKLVPPFEKLNFQTEKLEGSFGNDIISVKLEFEKQAEIVDLLEFIKSNLSDSDIDIDAHVTENNEFWIRFDKQKAHEGKVIAGRGDVIQLKGKVAAFPAKREKAVEMMEKLWS